jgi:O-antigen/teichoic acid export membrane protein
VWEARITAEAELPAGRRERTLAVRRAFVTGAAGKVVTVILGLVSVGLLVRAVGASPYGLIATFTGAIGLLGFLDFGVGNGLIGKVGAAHARHDDDTLGEHVAETMVLLSCTASLLIGATVAVAVMAPVAALPGGSTMPVGTLRAAVMLFGVCVAIAGPASVGSKVALGRQRGRENSFVAMSSALAMLVLIFTGQVFDAPFLYFFAVALLTPVLGNSVQTIALLSRITWFKWVRVVRARSVVQLLRNGVPFTVLVLSGAISYQSDMLVVSYGVGLTAAATFGLLTRIYSSLSTFMNAGSQQLWASTAHALEQGDTDWVARTLKKTLILGGGGFAATSAVLIFVTPAFLDVWTGGRVETSSGLLVAFAVWYSYNYAMSLLSSVLNGAGRVKVQAVAAASMAIVNLPLSIYLVHVWGAAGPLWASCITHGLFVGAPTVTMIRRLLRSGAVERL